MNLRKYIPFFFDNLIWILLLGVIIIFAMLTDRFLTARNITNILVHASVLGILVIGQSFTLITGNFDLSMESTLALCALVGAWLITAAGPPANGSGLMLPPLLAIPIVLGIGLVIGWWNGFLITRLKMNNFIVTLAMLIIIRGMMLIVTEGNTISQIPAAFRALGHDKIGAVPLSIIMLFIAFIIAHIVMQYRRFGRDLYAVGGNKEAALAFGINPDKRIRHVYLLSGVLAALAGWMMVGRLGVVVANMGEGMIFEVFAAAVIGGISLQGGRGTMIGAFGGVLLLSTIDSGLNLMRVSSFWIETARGLVILMAMLIDAQKLRFSTPAIARSRTILEANAG